MKRAVTACAVIGAALAAAPFSLHAHAAEYTLSLQQTIALYGSEFEGTYYNADTGITSTVNFLLVGTSDNSVFAPEHTFGYNIYLDSTNITNSEIRNQYYSWIAGDNDTRPNTPYVIYRCNFLPPIQESFVSSNDANHTNIALSFPVSFSGVTAFYQNIMYSARTTQGRNRSSVLLTSGGGGISTNALATTSQGTYYARFRTYFPSYDNGNESHMAWLNAFAIRHETESTFNVSGQQLALNHCDVVHPDDQLQYAFLLYVGCPSVDYGAEPETTTVPMQTRPIYTGTGVTTGAYTVDLSNVESNQQQQIQIENENLNYNAGVFDGINIIIQQLNNIYAAMVNRGEIPVNLVAGLNPDIIDTDFMDYAAGVDETYTTATLPHSTLANSKSFITMLFRKIETFEGAFLLGSFALTLSVASFVIFRK